MKKLEAHKNNLQKQFDELMAIEAPTEEQLQQLESVEQELNDVTEQHEQVLILLEEAKEAKEVKTSEDNNFLADDEVPKGYKVPTDEKHLIHAAIRIGSRFDSETGEQKAQVFVQKYNKTDFKNLVRNATRLGIKYGILHKPEK